MSPEPHPSQPEGPSNRPWHERLREGMRLARWMLLQTFRPLPDMLPPFNDQLAVPDSHRADWTPALTEEQRQYQHQFEALRQADAPAPRYLQEAERAREEASARRNLSAAETELPPAFRDVIAQLDALDHLDD